jgi:hypothetical protein
MAEDAARELPNLPLEDALQLVKLYAERGSPKYEKAPMRWLERYAALTSGGGARSAPQVFTITTAGEASQRHDSILGRLLDAGLDAEDVEREPGLTICRLPEARTLVYEYAAPTIDPRDVQAMKLANPASWITEAYLRRQADDPELTDAQVLQLHGCVWAATESTWIAPEAWAARKVARALEDGERLVLGFDGSYRRDATALVACTLDGFVSPIAVWERPDRAPVEWKVPRGEVDDAIAEAMERFEVLELACDPPGWHSELDSWREAYGDVVVDFATNERRRAAAACNRFSTGVLEGDLSHDGSAVLARHVGHCVAKPTPYGRSQRRTTPTAHARSTPRSPRSSPTTGRCGTRPIRRSLCRSSRSRNRKERA